MKWNCGSVYAFDMSGQDEADSICNIILNINYSFDVLKNVLHKIIKSQIIVVLRRFQFLLYVNGKCMNLSVVRINKLEQS